MINFSTAFLKFLLFLVESDAKCSLCFGDEKINISQTVADLVEIEWNSSGSQIMSCFFIFWFNLDPKADVPRRRRTSG